MFDAMKQIFLAILIALPLSLRAQDAATEERLNKLTAQIQDLADAREAQNKKIEALAKAIDALQQQVSKPTGNYASQDDLKHLADELQDLDKRRKEDDDRILKGVEKELKNLSATAATPKPAPTKDATTDPKPASDKFFEHEMQSGETLSVIVAAYKEKNIKITVDQILKANPGLDPKKLKIGQKILIPVPTQ
jgi:LysM repeat protein